METLWTRYDSWGFFPDRVNRGATRLVALVVALLAFAGLLYGALWIAPLLLLGFFLRTWQGPRFDPLARAALWSARRLDFVQEVDGPPKRFAQLLGLLLMLLASTALLLGWPAVTAAGLLLLFLLASLESLGGVCLGCLIFRLLMQRGIIPEQICQRCADWRA